MDTISSGEYNRLRLALLTSMSEFDIVDNGILFLDEIDANLSGKESDAISKVLKKLRNSYQIFAISHQPQLTSSADQHFLVDKINGKSLVKELNNKDEIKEALIEINKRWDESIINIFRDVKNMEIKINELVNNNINKLLIFTEML